jgi:hypothetical protein
LTDAVNFPEPELRYSSLESKNAWSETEWFMPPVESKWLIEEVLRSGL